MKINLDSVRGEIETYLTKNGFLLFHGFSRRVGDMPEVEWDSNQYPDYKRFLNVARELGVRLIVMHHREFDSEVIDHALEELPATGYEYDEQATLERRLRELNVYDGFTCAVEISFEHQATLYVFELRTEWYNELNEILEELDLGIGVESSSDDEDESPLGGYYSKN